MIFLFLSAREKVTWPQILWLLWMTIITIMEEKAATVFSWIVITALRILANYFVYKRLRFIGIAYSCCSHLVVHNTKSSILAINMKTFAFVLFLAIATCSADDDNNISSVFEELKVVPYVIPFVPEALAIHESKINYSIETRYPNGYHFFIHYLVYSVLWIYLIFMVFLVLAARFLFSN